MDLFFKLYIDFYEDYFYVLNVDQTINVFSMDGFYLT